MFRLLAHNTGQSLRPVLRNVRPSAGPLKLPGTGSSIEVEKNYQFRSNATLASAVNTVNSSAATTSASTSSKTCGREKTETVFAGFSGDRHDPEFAQTQTQTSPQISARRFEELLGTTMNSTTNNRGKAGSIQSFDGLRVLVNLFRDDAVRLELSAEDVFRYTNVLNEAVYSNRMSRLKETRNRDSDQYSSTTLKNDIWLKNAVSHLADQLSHAPLQKLVNHATLRKLLFVMMQLQMPSELLRLWEQGVNNAYSNKTYLHHTVLAVVLPVAYAEKRFSYEQVIKLYEVNTEGHRFVTHHLSSAIGKVAIQEGDYSRALDCLEMVLARLEAGRDNEDSVHRTLAELHAAFIGECKDIKIARHFFTKTVEKQLPYKVALKAPHVQKLMHHCVEADEPFETIFDFWKQSLSVYAKESHATSNARYSLINKAFLSIFFNMYPTLTEEAYLKLREVIAAFASIKPVDDFFLNNIVSNYTWGDKVVFEQLIDNYAVYEVTETAISYRVILKKMGEIKEFSSSEILNQWNTTLKFLDGAGFNYIPIADWASLREATILSPYRTQRTELYLAVLNAYKNYHQDDKAVNRFVKHWSTKPQASLIASVSSEAPPKFSLDVAIEIPQFTNLKENVNYNTVASNTVVSTREENDARSQSRF